MLDHRVNDLVGRVRNRYQRRANYTEIGRCKQKPDEPFDEYRVRLETVFKTHSGLVDGGQVRGPYRQQLKNALHAGSAPDIQGWVNRHYIGLGGGTLDEYVDHALHAEKVVKSKKGKKAETTSTVFYQGEEQEVYYQQQRSRGRGRSRGRSFAFRGNKGRGFGSRGDNPRTCWSCGKEGHMARDCRTTFNTHTPA